MSIRVIRTLAQGYFKGSGELRRPITDGNIPWCLRQLKKAIKSESGCNGDEQRMLTELDRVLRAMQGITVNSYDNRLKSDAFFAQANLLTKDLLNQVPDQPGQEMQHDTTTYTLLIDDIPSRVVAMISSLKVISIVA